MINVHRPKEQYIGDAWWTMHSYSILYSSNGGNVMRWSLFIYMLVCMFLFCTGNFTQSHCLQHELWFWYVFILQEHFVSLRAEFSNEVTLLKNIEHRNLVQLLGYIDKANERLIITEYVSNGTLREHLDCKLQTRLLVSCIPSKNV